MSPKTQNIHKISHKGPATQLITADINVDLNEAEVLFVGVSQCSPQPVWTGREENHGTTHVEGVGYAASFRVEHQH